MTIKHELDGTIPVKMKLVDMINEQFADEDEAYRWERLTWTDAIVINYGMHLLHESLTYVVYRDFRKGLDTISKRGIEHGLATGIGLGLLRLGLGGWVLYDERYPAQVAQFQGYAEDRIERSPAQPLSDTALAEIAQATETRDTPPRREANVRAALLSGLQVAVEPSGEGLYWKKI